MKTTLAIILYLNANLQPVLAPDVMPFAMTKAACLALSDDETEKGKMLALARESEPKVAFAMIGCSTQSDRVRDALGRSLIASVPTR